MQAEVIKSPFMTKNSILVCDIDSDGYIIKLKIEGDRRWTISSSGGNFSSKNNWQILFCITVNRFRWNFLIYHSYRRFSFVDVIVYCVNLPFLRWWYCGIWRHLCFTTGDSNLLLHHHSSCGLRVQKTSVFLDYPMNLLPFFFIFSTL